MLLLLLGLAGLGGLLWEIDFLAVFGVLSQLSPWALPILLLPSVAMYLIDAAAWRVTVPMADGLFGFWKLLAIRTAGEAVNITTPTASLGGEPVKAYLLTAFNVPLAQGLASVIVAKAAMIVAQIAFMLIGLAMGMYVLWEEQSIGTLIMGSVVAVGMAIFLAGGMMAIRLHGFFSGLYGVLDRLGIRTGWLERHKAALLAVDRNIMEFYAGERARCFLAAGLFLLGFCCEGLEVSVILWFLGATAAPMAALSIGALSLLIKNGSSFIPWSLGAQDGGNMLLVSAFGWAEPIGVAFALLRRVREAVWIGAGLLLLLVLPGGRREQAVGESG
jgi:uncharacterized protein (TIRG00374 family)